MKINQINSLNYGIKKKNSKNIKNNSVIQPNYQQKELSNIYYQPLNFTRTLKEHNSWGVRPSKDGIEPSSAKIFTYPDAKNVAILINKGSENEKTFLLENKGQGIFEGKINPKDLKNGDRYSFVIQKKDGSFTEVKDPYSFKQPEILGQSEAYDHSKYQWNDDKWYSPDNKQRISRKADAKNGLTHIKASTIYELNIATITPEGTFESAKTKLKEIKHNVLYIL